MLFLAVAWLPLHRARSPRPRPVEPAVDRQRHGHLRRRSGRARPGARSERRDSRRALHGRRRGGAVHRPARHHAGREGRADWRDHAADAADAGQSRRLADEVFDDIRAGVQADRSQFFKDLSVPFFGGNRPGASFAGRARHVLAARHAGGLQRRLRLHQGLLGDRPHRDLKKFDVPTLIVHGDDDQIVPIGASASSRRRS